jgi:hypothetical protein
MRQQTEKYTSEVTPQYKKATSRREIRYTIKENLERNPDVEQEFNAWLSKQPDRPTPTFTGVFHDQYIMSLFDLRTAEVREDWGQRNALDQGRQKKIIGIAKNFDKMQFQPIDVDYILDLDVYIIRDGGGRATAAYLNRVFLVPACVRIVNSYEESRRLFNAQDKFAAAISSHDKYLQQLLDPKHARHNMACDLQGLAAASGFSLHYSQQSAATPLIEGISTLQRVIRVVGGDHADVKCGAKRAPNIATAVDVIKATFLGIEVIPVSAIEAVTAFIHISKNRLPSGEEGQRRLYEFFAAVRDSEISLSSLDNWTTALCFDSSNNYATYGASAFMEKWNAIFKNKNKGRTSTYKYVKWKDFEIEITKKNIVVFARDESLYRNP